MLEASEPPEEMRIEQRHCGMPSALMYCPSWFVIFQDGFQAFETCSSSCKLVALCSAHRSLDKKIIVWLDILVLYVGRHIPLAFSEDCTSGHANSVVVDNNKY